jgi:hypothetical protein
MQPYSVSGLLNNNLAKNYSINPATTVPKSQRQLSLPAIRAEKSVGNAMAGSMVL